jgi:hypothetical protein
MKPRDQTLGIRALCGLDRKALTPALSRELPPLRPAGKSLLISCPNVPIVRLISMSLTGRRMHRDHCEQYPSRDSLG